MSSIIISRIILTAFLAVSLSACSKGGKGSKATVRNKGSQTATTKTTPTLDADKADLNNKKTESPSETADTNKAPVAEANNDEGNNTDTPTAAPVSGGSSIIVKALPPAPKAATVPVPTPAARPATQAPAVQTPVVKTPTKPVATATPAQPATTRASVDKSAPAPWAETSAAKPTQTTPTKAEKDAEQKRLAEEKIKADAEREAARRQIVIKSEEDLDRDDASKENLSSTAYKALVDKLLAGVDLSSRTRVSWANDTSYFSFVRDTSKSQKNIPVSLSEKIYNSKICDIGQSKGCLLIEVTKNNNVVAAYIGTEEKVVQGVNGLQSFIYRQDILKPDAAFQADIETLSRIAGGKTVVFTQVKNSSVAAE